MAEDTARRDQLEAENLEPIARWRKASTAYARSLTLARMIERSVVEPQYGLTSEQLKEGRASGTLGEPQPYPPLPERELRAMRLKARRECHGATIELVNACKELAPTVRKVSIDWSLELRRLADALDEDLFRLSANQSTSPTLVPSSSSLLDRVRDFGRRVDELAAVENPERPKVMLKDAREVSDRLVTVNEAVELLDASESAVRRWIGRKRDPLDWVDKFGPVASARYWLSDLRARQRAGSA